MQVLTLYSVETGSQRVYAFVPGSHVDALRRLVADDPLWRKPSVYLHWTWCMDVDHARVRLRDRINFRAVPL